MHPTTQKVLERLIYERLLISSDVSPRRSKIFLDDILFSAGEEPRIYSVLPAVILYKPSVISKLKKDLPRFPKIQKFCEELFAPGHPKKFFSAPAEECQKNAVRFRDFLNHKKNQNKSTMRTFRFSKQDLELLETLSQRLHVGNLSETLRLLLREKVKSLGSSASR